MAADNPHHTKLDKLFETMQSLSPTSSPKELEAFGAFFDGDRVVHLISMREHLTPASGRAGVIMQMQAKLKNEHITDIHVLSRSTTVDGNTIFCETKQRIEVCGEVVDPYFETAVASFTSDGLILSLKLYSCRSPVLKVIQDKTGNGPYRADYDEWQTSMEASMQPKSHAGVAMQQTLCCD